MLRHCGSLPFVAFVVIATQHRNEMRSKQFEYVETLSDTDPNPIEMRQPVHEMKVLHKKCLWS